MSAPSHRDEPAPTPLSTRGEIELLVHDLKSPVAVAETALRTLLEKREKYGPLTERQERTLRRALRGTRRTRRQLDDLLELGRAEAQRFSVTRFRLADLIADRLVEAVETVEPSLLEEVDEERDAQLAALAAAGIAIENPPGEDVFLEQDAAKLGQVLANLLRNGLQFKRRSLQVRTAHEEERVRVEVLDDGPGIPGEHRETVFDRYARLGEGGGPSGHGLGLAGARYLARRLGGEISAAASPSGGACFRLTVPRILPRATAQANESKRPSTQRSETEESTEEGGS